MRYKWLTTVIILALLFSCGGETLPKPKGMLRLDYPEARHISMKYEKFRFEGNSLARVGREGKDAITLDYPLLNAAIYITYKPVEDNLNSLLSDAQRLSYEHVIKADDITEQPYINPEDSVYGMFYEVSGDAASQSQFYVTDSTRNFVTGSLYFYAKPNYDSIYPAAVYLQKDIRRIMETIQWE
ncbi:gliding motility lipoprotein GldD [Lentiprolixibacter aurantiacus]|uniref:Gliding motility lipoprotein GldD n=1 Tax=Lentiprolixibacter aurantiacus TaxID=2993939 RepID=A0AAE3SMG9_9FLAO|nr:gliding motility lipoprotein GldD [Lentiprolixibacter aurantiacus]MCX2718276.1 gliding motility lipoprotein GldD [Lentiprolixibacter aurantiacus]